MVQNKVVIYKSIPEGLPINGKDLVLETEQFDIQQDPPAGGVTLKNLYASYDPYLRGKMRDPNVKSYSAAYQLNDPMTTAKISEVIKSDNSVLKAGDLVTCFGPIAQYSVVLKDAAKFVKKIDNKYDLDPLYYLGPMGMPGITAYSGLFEIGKPKKGETIFVSAASGAVGQLVGVLAREEGLKVVGSVGSDEKLDFTLKELKFDGCFNYKKEKAADALKRLCPEGVDIFWDNVGAETLEAAIVAMNNFGRIITCGMISQYNLKPEDEYRLGNIQSFYQKRLTMRGFIQSDPGFADKYVAERDEKVGKLLKEGKLPVKMSVTEGMDNAIDGLLGIFKGENFGKAVLKIADPGGL